MAMNSATATLIPVMSDLFANGVSLEVSKAMSSDSTLSLAAASRRVKDRLAAAPLIPASYPLCDDRPPMQAGFSIFPIFFAAPS